MMDTNMFQKSQSHIAKQSTNNNYNLRLFKFINRILRKTIENL